MAGRIHPTSRKGQQLNMSGKDFIATLDEKKHEEDWSHTIIGAMARIQAQFAIEQKLNESLPKDYFTDADRLKFFWSGFSNSSNIKHVADVFFRSIINWEIIFLILVMIFAQTFFLARLDGVQFLDTAVFFGSYLSVVGYSLYITYHCKYYVYGDMSSRMMLALILGRILFLTISASILSYTLYWIADYFSKNPKDLYGWTSGLYWVFDLFMNAKNWFGSKQTFYISVYENVLPQLAKTSREMLFVFVAAGILPPVVMFIVKSLRTARIRKERKLFGKGK